jgi:hypothetical protein
VVEIFDSAGNSLGASGDTDYQEDLIVPVTVDGAYYVKVAASQAGYFDPTHTDYQLLIDLN